MGVPGDVVTVTDLGGPSQATGRTKPRSVVRRFGEVFGVAAAYLVAGKLALLLAIPPGYATPVWPAAGIAAVAVLVLGYRVLPGIVVGSFFVNIGTSFDATSTMAILKSITVAASIGLGAALQAAAAAWLWRRFIGYPTALVGEGDIARFLLLGGPVACLVAASWAPTTLLLAGILPASSYAFSWWTWWVGDSIGVVIFGPLLLAFVGQPRDPWRRRRRTVALPLAVGFAVVTAFFIRVSNREEARLNEELAAEVRVLARAIERKVDQNVQVARSVADLHASDPEVTRDEFRKFVAGPLSREPGIGGIGWIPRISDSNRAAYERAIRREGFPSFEIRIRARDGAMLRAPDRSEYFPISFAEPYEGNERALGFDLASEPVRRETIQRARDDDRVLATTGLHLVQDLEPSPGIVLFAAVYRSDDRPRDVAERRATLKGMVALVVRPEQLVASALGGLDRAKINLQLVIGDEAGRETVLYQEPSATTMRQRNAGAVVSFGGRQLRLHGSRTLLAGHETWQPWIVLAGGLFFVGILGAILLIVTGDTTRVRASEGALEVRVNERTRELGLAYESVARAKERLDGLISIAADAIISVDDQQRIELFNEGAEDIFGWTQDEILGQPLDVLIPARFRSLQRRYLTSFSEELPTARRMAERRPVIGLRKNGEEFPAEAAISKLRLGAGHLLTIILRDTSARTRLENELVESRRFLENVLDSSTEYSLIAFDLSGRIQMWNEGAHRLYGYEAADVLGRSGDLLHVPGDAADSTAARLQEALIHGTARGVFRRRRKDGSELDVRAVITRRDNARGRPIGFLKISVDISAEQRAEAERAFLAHIGDVLASTLDSDVMARRVVEASVPFLGDLAGVLLMEDDHVRLETFHADPALAQVFVELRRKGISKRGAMWRSYRTKRPVIIREVASDFLEQVTDDPEHYRPENPRSIIAVPLLAHGRCHGAISFGARPSDHRSGADALRLAEELARRFASGVDNAMLYEKLRFQSAIATHLSEGIALIRAQDAVIVYANPRFEEMFGYASSQVIGKPMSVINAPRESSSEQFVEDIRDKLEAAGIWHGETETISKDGARSWCYASFSTFDHPRLGAVWVSVYTDISERKRLEDVQSRAFREREILLKEIHHRVKNNLQVISSLFYLQGQQGPHGEQERFRQLLDESRNRIQSIAMVHDQLSRSASLSEIDFGEYLKSLARGMGETYGASTREIAIDVIARGVFLDIESAVPCGLLVGELVSNALKHAFPGNRPGRVRVCASLDDAGNVELAVTDDGVGIPETLDWRRTETLGLQLVHSLTTQLNGTIALERSGGTRMTVRFGLPSHPPMEKTARIEPSVGTSVSDSG